MYFKVSGVSVVIFGARTNLTPRPRLGAIMTTHGLEDTLVIRMNSEAAAMRLWRAELRSGKRIACIGQETAEQVCAKNFR